mmetsp:Transcript_7562/g.8681  ORF Transcript_7562/g.8681 Transcript_7562/m.8681 type:complete len:350 (+) Transcript_7562:125-1174(+)
MTRALYMRSEEATISVSVPPEKPFIRIPAVAAASENEVYFGSEALKKSEIEGFHILWLLYPPRSSKAVNKLFLDFIRYIAGLPAVVSELKECDFVLLCFPQSMQDKLNFNWHDFGVFFQSSDRDIRAYTISQERLSGYSMNQRRLVLNISYEYTSLTLISEGNYVLEKLFIPLGFERIVNYFIKLLCQKGYDLTSTSGKEICKDLAKKYCYIADDFDRECKRLDEVNGVLHKIQIADGSEIELGKECFLAPELLLNPALDGLDTDGLISLFGKKTFKTSNVLVAGSFGENLIGLPQRVAKELRQRKVPGRPFYFVKADAYADFAGVNDTCFQNQFRTERSYDFPDDDSI